MIQIPCPVCESTFPADRLGIATFLERHAGVTVDVHCPVCATDFSATVDRKTQNVRTLRRFWTTTPIESVSITTKPRTTEG